MLFYGDYHTHSRYSDGGQSIEDIVAAAAAKGLREVAITDHGPLCALVGVREAGIYRLIRKKVGRLRKDYPELGIFVGAEANIRDLKGTLDLTPEVIGELDLLIAGLHPYTWPVSLKDLKAIWLQNSLSRLGSRHLNRAVKANTQACIAAVQNNPCLDILAHPGLFFKIDIGAVAQACAENKVLFEINCGHRHPAISDIIEAKGTGVEFIVNSDAHFPEKVGDLNYASRVVEESGLEPARIINRFDGGGIARWGKKGKVCTYS